MHRVSSTSARRRDDSGAAAVEFALVSMLLFALLFGVVQYGFYFWSMQAGSAAVREAARQAAVGNLSCAELDTFVADRLGPASFGGSIDATRTFPATPKVGDTVTISVSFNSLDLNLPLVPLPDDAAIHQDAQTRVENVNAAESVSCP